MLDIIARNGLPDVRSAAAIASCPGKRSVRKNG